jgi:dipeptide transport system ATP-binding protein
MMLLEAKGLTLAIKIGSAEVPVLRDVSFALAPGKILGLVGESGAGKTMIARIVGQSLPRGFRVTAGSLGFRGTDLLDISPLRHRALLGNRIAFIPQEPLSSLNPVLTVGQQFTEHLKRLGIHRRDRRDRAAALLAEVRLPDPATLLELYPFQLSGGMCQRVLLALAFASDPELIVADEPTTALDVSTQAHIVTLLRRLQASRRTGIVFITHDLRLAAHLCDEIIVLYAGDVVEHGSAKQVFGAPRHPYTGALRRANPPLDGPRHALPSLPEHMPGLAAYAAIPGCRFAPRCPIADPACRAAPPQLREIAAGHFVRCSPGCVGGNAAEMVLSPIVPRPANSAAPPILRLAGVSKIYRGPRLLLRRRRAVAAVRAASLAVAPGEFVGIVGESGSGKSTLARLVMGLETPSAGHIELAGRKMARRQADWAARIRTVQMIFQDPQSALNPRRSVASLATQALETAQHAQPRAARQARALALLREAGLPAELAPRFPPQLSGGQRQRVNIARALCMTPPLIVADEIVSGLDVLVQAQILNLLLRLRETHGIALLFISHDLSVVRYLCSRIVVMHRGEIVEDGATEQVFAAPRHPYTRSLLAAVPPDAVDKPWPPEDIADVALRVR